MFVHLFYISILFSNTQLIVTTKMQLIQHDYNQEPLIWLFTNGYSNFKNSGSFYFLQSVHCGRVLRLTPVWLQWKIYVWKGHPGLLRTFGFYTIRDGAGRQVSSTHTIPHTQRGGLTDGDASEEQNKTTTKISRSYSDLIHEASNYC